MPVPAPISMARSPGHSPPSSKMSSKRLSGYRGQYRSYASAGALNSNDRCLAKVKPQSDSRLRVSHGIVALATLDRSDQCGCHAVLAYPLFNTRTKVLFNQRGFLITQSPRDCLADRWHQRIAGAG